MIWWKSLDTLMKRVVSLSVLALILVLFLFAVSFCHQRDKAARLSDDIAKSDTRTGSAVVAIEEIDKLGERNQVAKNELEKAHDAIRQASPSDRDAIARRQLECLQHGSACNGV